LRWHSINSFNRNVTKILYIHHSRKKRKCVWKQHLHFQNASGRFQQYHSLHWIEPTKRIDCVTFNGWRKRSTVFRVEKAPDFFEFQKCVDFSKRAEIIPIFYTASDELPNKSPSGHLFIYFWSLWSDRGIQHRINVVHLILDFVSKYQGLLLSQIAPGCNI